MSSSRDTSREYVRGLDNWKTQYEETAELLEAKGYYRAADDVRTLVDGLIGYEHGENHLREAFRDACAEVAKWRMWYGFADFGLTEAPDEQVQDVQQEYMTKAREQA